MNLRGLVIMAFVLGMNGLNARPYFNDQEVPKSLDDLRNIQKTVQGHLEATRAATVCVQLKDGSGTGVIISPEGLVLTAAHVSTGVGVELTLVLEDGRELSAKSLGLNSENDAAMVKIIDEGPFPYVPYNTQADYKVGDWVYSLGHSGGFDKARGLVTRVGRLVTLSPDTIQSDCILIGGDSGGPLYDMSGTLIGIHSRLGKLKEDSRHVPLEAFARSWEDMESGEFLGEGPFAQKRFPGTGYLGLKTVFDVEIQRLMILEVEEGSPADQSGLEAGMSILEVDQEAVNGRDLIAEKEESFSAGDFVVLTWQREARRGNVRVQLAKKESSEEMIEQEPSS